MARPKRTAKQMARPSPPEILPTAAYRAGELPSLLRVGKPTVLEALRTGELKSALLGASRLVLGLWILEWIDALRVIQSEQPRPPDAPHVPGAEAGAGQPAG